MFNKVLTSLNLHLRVTTSKVELAEFAMHFGKHFRWRLARANNCFKKEEGIENSVPLRNVALDAYPTGFLRTKENIVLEHQISNVFETDGGFKKFQIMGCGNTLKQNRLREGTDYAAAHVALADEMTQKQRDDIVH